MRQTELAGTPIRDGRCVSLHENFRLNPAERRHAVRMEVQNSVLVGEAAFELGEGVVVEGRLRCGLQTRVSCRMSAFRGVAARLSLSKDDRVIAELVLLHRDASLNVTLARSNDLVELAADWQMWARRFNLPLILIEPDGVEQMVSKRIGALDVAATRPRRPSAFSATRRPRFLRRRKKGTVDFAHRIGGREIIARN